MLSWAPHTYIKVHFLPFRDLRSSKPEEGRDAHEQGRTDTYLALLQVALPASRPGTWLRAYCLSSHS